MISGNVRLLSNFGFRSLEDIATKKLSFKAIGIKNNERVEVVITAEKLAIPTNQVLQIQLDDFAFWGTLNQQFQTSRGSLSTSELGKGDTFVNDLKTWSYFKDSEAWHPTPRKLEIQFINRAFVNAAPVNVVRIYPTKSVDYLIMATGVRFKPN